MRITWPASIPGLLGKTPVAGSPLVLDSEGVVQLGIPSGGGGIPEAPIDGELYGRQDGAWKLVSDDFLTQATADLTYLQLAGGTMSGDIQMAGNTVTGLPDPVSPSDAVNLDYIVGRLSGKENIPSGVVSGGELSFTAPSTITVAAGTGTIVDSYTNPLSPTVQLVSWVQQSVDVGLVTSRPRTSVYIDNTGTLQFIADPNPPGTNIWRQNIYLGYAFHDYADTGQIIGVNEIRALPGQTADSLIDFIRATALFPILLESTGGFSPNADLTFNIADQVWWAPGVSESTTPEDPNFKYVTAQSPAQFFYINSLGSILTGSTVPTTLITPGLYEPTPDTPTAIPGNAQRSTIQRVYVTLAGNTAVMLGQQYWDNLDDALLYINQDIAEHVVPQQLRFARLVAYIILEKGSTDLQDGTDVIIVNEEGIPIGGGSVPVHGHDGTYVRLDGSNGPMQGSLNFGNYNIINLADPVNPQDAATKFYVDAADSLLDDRLNDLEVLAPYLRLVGGTMLGDIDMGGINVVVNMGDPTNPQDATTKFYVDQADAALDARLDVLELNAPYLPLAGGTMSGAIDMDSNRITNLPAPVDPDDAARLSSLDAYLPLTGGTITGGLTVDQGVTFNSIVTLGGTSGLISGVKQIQGRASETLVLKWLAGGNFELRDSNSVVVLGVTGSLLTSAVQLNMSNQKIVSLATPTDPADAATKQYVDDNSGGGGGVPPGGIRGDEIVKLSGTNGDADWRERVSFGTSSPPAPIVGDLWVDESSSNVPYLPLTGGTMTGNITMTDQTRVSFPNSTAGLAWLSIDPTDPSGATFRLRLGGSTQSVDIFSLQAAGDRKVVDWYVKDSLTLGQTMYGSTLRFLNSTDDLAGQIYAFDATGREILIMGANKVRTSLNASRIQIYGSAEGGNNGIQYYAYGYTISGNPASGVPGHRFYINNQVGVNQFLLELNVDHVVAKKGIQAITGNPLALSIAFEAEPSLGWYRYTSNQVGFVVGGNLRQRFGNDFHYWTENVTNPRFQGWNNFFTTSQAVNVHISTGSDAGRFYRFTSSKRYKKDISYEEDFSHIPIPSSARWLDKQSDGEEEPDLTVYVGYIAEDWAELDSRFAVYGPEGTVENIVDRSIMAVLGDHIKALEARVAELEGQCLS